MNAMKRKLMKISLVAVVVIAAAGCSQPQHANRRDALNRWTAARGSVIYGLALQQFEVGDLDKAEKTCTQGLQTDPNNAMFFELAGRIALERGHLERAFHMFEQSIALGPGRSEPHYMLGVLLQRWQRPEQALEAYETAYKFAPDQVNALLAISEMLVELGRENEAVNRLEEKLVYFENNAAIRVALGRIYLMQRDFDDAVDVMTEASLLAPEDGTVLEQLAMAEFAAEHYASATRHLEQILDRKELGERIDLKLALGDCYVATDDLVPARRMFLEITAADPTNVNAWIKFGQVAWMVGDLQRARHAAGRVVSLDPQRYEGYLLQGILHRRAGDHDQALSRFERASRLAPDSAAPLILKGLTFEQLGESAAAGRAYQSALKIDPDDARARQLLASVEGAAP